MLGDTGSVNLPPSIITDLTSTFFDPVIGWILGIAAVVAYAASLFAVRRRRETAGLEVGPMFVVDRCGSCWSRQRWSPRS